jgi:hypothetical protein
VNANGGRLQVDVPDEPTVLTALGTNVVLPTDSTRQERANRVFDSVTDPQPTARIVDGGKVFAGPGSPYGLEILAAPVASGEVSQAALVAGLQPRSAQLSGRLPFVSLERGEAYAIRLINNSKFDAAVKLSIDGLSVFAFSELRVSQGRDQGEPLYSVWIIPPGESRVIPGWHMNNSRVDAFLVTEYAKSAAAMKSRTTDLGVISAVFSAAWGVDAEGNPINMPPDEPPRTKGAGNATGFGPPISVQLQEVRRMIGAPRATVTVRYARPAVDSKP